MFPHRSYEACYSPWRWACRVCMVYFTPNIPHWVSTVSWSYLLQLLRRLRSQNLCSLSGGTCKGQLSRRPNHQRLGLVACLLIFDFDYDTVHFQLNLNPLIHRRKQFTYATVMFLPLTHPPREHSQCSSPGHIMDCKGRLTGTHWWCCSTRQYQQYPN